MPFAIVEIRAAPISAFRISPRPPKRLVPPITAAAIAVDQQRAAAGVQVDAAAAAREDDAAEAGHEAGDHEDEDPDPRRR